jgi:hypothetical protein
LGTIFSLSNWPGHLSYALIAISYWLTDIFWLRVVAVVGLSLEILYFWHSGGDLRTGIGWDLIFIAINLYQLYRLAKDRLSLRLPEADRDVLRSAFSGLDDSQIARLLVAGEFIDLAGGTMLAEENRALDKIFFICSGRVAVTIAGRAVSHVEQQAALGRQRLSYMERANRQAWMAGTSPAITTCLRPVGGAPRARPSPPSPGALSASYGRASP